MSAREEHVQRLWGIPRTADGGAFVRREAVLDTHREISRLFLRRCPAPRSRSSTLGWRRRRRALGRRRGWQSGRREVTP